MDCLDNWTAIENRLLNYLKDPQSCDHGEALKYVTSVLDSLNQCILHKAANFDAELYKRSKLCIRVLDIFDNKEILIINAWLVLIESLLHYRECTPLAVTDLWWTFGLFSSILPYDDTNFTEAPNWRTMFEGFRYKKNVYSLETVSLMTQFNVLLLKLYSKSAQAKYGDLISMKEMIELTKKGSNFSAWFEGLPEDGFCDMSRELSLICQKLVSHSPCDYSVRLLLLLRCLSYDAQCETIDSDLLTLIRSALNKTNRPLLNSTRQMFKEILSTYKSKNIDTTQLRQVSMIYDETHSLDQEIDSDSSTSSSALTELLDGMEIVQFSKFSRMLATCSDWSLLDSLSFGKGLYNAIKEANFTDPDSQYMICSTLSFIRRAGDVRIGRIVHILDYIIIKIKNMQVCDHSVFVNSVLEDLFDILSMKSQPKRVRNVSNLFFHFGGELLTTDNQSALQFWNRCVDIEYHIVLNSVDESERKLNFTSFKTKSERIANLLLETSEYQNAAQFLSKVFSYPDCSTIFEYETCLMQNDFSVPVKLAVKLLLMSQSPELLLLISQKESYLVALADRLVSVLTSTKHYACQKLVSKIIILLKNELHDNGLFLYFLSRIAFVMEFNMTFKSMGNLEFEPESDVYSLRKIIKAHIYILQSFSSTFDPDKSLLNAYNNLLEFWRRPNTTSILDYEIDVIVSAAEVFEYHYLFCPAASFLEPYVKTQLVNLPSRQQRRVALELAKCYFYLHQPAHFCSLNDIFIGQDDVASMSYRLLKLWINLRLGNSPKQLEDQYNILLSRLSEDTFSISKERNRYAVIDKLFLLSQVSNEYSLLCASNSQYVCSVISSKRAIRILQSILKNFMLQSNSSSFGLNLSSKVLLKYRFSKSMIECYETLLENLHQSGLGKEFDYFTKEFWTFVNSQPSLYVKSRCLFQFAIYYSYQNRLVEAKRCLDLATSQYIHLGIMDKLLGLTKLLANEIYYEKLGDSQTFLGFVHQYDHCIKQLLGAVPMQSSKTKFSNAEILRSYDYSNDTDMLTKNWMSIQLTRSLSPYWQHTESPFPSSDKLFAARVQFNERCTYSSAYSTLQILNDSVISFPSSCSVKNMGTEVSTVSNSAEVFSAACSDLRASSSVEFKDSLLRLALSIITMIPCSSVDSAKKWISRWKDYANSYNSRQFAIERCLSKTIEDPKVFLSPHFSFEVSEVDSLTCQQLTNIIPDDWMVIELECMPLESGLTVTRIKSQDSNPLVVRLPFGWQRGGDIHERFTVTDAIQAFEEIIKKSDETTAYEVTSRIRTKEDKAEWWSIRKGLDKGLGRLLRKMESCWFGGFGSLFGSMLFTERVVKDFKNTLVEAIVFRLPKGTSSKVVDRLNGLETWIFEMFLQLQENPDDQDSLTEDLVYFVLDTISGYGEDIAYDEVDVNKLCQEIGQYQLGVPSCGDSIHHIILVASGECVKLPWESIPSLRNKSVSRMPSLGMITEYLQDNHSLLEEGINPGNGYYVLNPGGDLMKTEQRFKDKFETMAGWEGVCNNKPTENDILKSFERSDLYFYAGHGGGEQYIRSKTIKSSSKIPPCLLMGCSSGYLHVEGDFYPYGTVYHYLAGKCPMILANLWDVTDKDLDKFTLNVLEKWGLLVDYDSFASMDEDPEVLTICRCVADSRDVCKLKYLNGAAPVVYGLPLKLKPNDTDI
ncbi:hypothetical protein FOA43_003297 [Brettanomyces nanus]|uniref:separase n=1 Tax=Eeniella nana TaxID=13502 RepID=A0A875S2G2_EENNA|nr:uncharacterized protein FOA43_003297 [Brettanomyces nanus]QPG75911.1 hypothetical protein FOA43_003297 [Brettanomyces nanus]